MKFYIYSMVAFLLFSGCGYKPSSYYAKKAIEGKVYVDLVMNMDNTQNTVFIKDAMNELILNEFTATLTNDKEEADTYVVVSLSSASHSSISTGDDGYTDSYRTTVVINVKYTKKGLKTKSLNVSDYYDFSVDSDSVVTDQKKKTAVKNAASKALSNLFSKIAVQNMKE